MNPQTTVIERYYDSHPFEGEEMGQSRLHSVILRILTAVLEFLFQEQVATVLVEASLYQTADPKEEPLQPDLAVVPVAFTLQEHEEHPSYHIGEDGPPPPLIIEIASKETWRTDLEKKPAKYAAMGVREYFAFDPNTKSVWTRDWKKEERLIGWRRDEKSGQMVKLSKDQQERLWSEELQSFLVVEGRELILLDVYGERRLTKVEALARSEALEKLRADTAEARVRQEQAKAEAERKRAEAALKAEQTKAEAALKAEQTKAEKLAALLRELGQNPDEII